MKRLLVIHHPGNAFSNPFLQSFIQHALSHSIEIDIRCRTSLAPKPELNNLRWLTYGNIISRIKKFYFKKLYFEALFWPENITSGMNRIYFEKLNFRALIWLTNLCEVLFVFKKKYDLIIGIDREGLIDAGHYSHFLKIPYVYFSFEIMFSDEIGINNKILEKRYSKNVSLWVAQDQIRANCLVEENNLSPDKCFICPIASAGAGELSHVRLRDALGIDEKKKVAIMIGSLSEWSMSGEIIKSVETWPEDWVLIIHERYGRAREKLKNEIGKALYGTRIVCSTSVTDNLDDMGTILAGVDVGLAFYKPLYTTPYNGKNLKYIGLSSGKIATYLRYGVPILTNNIGIYADIIKTNNLGLVLESPDSLGSVLDILNRPEYSDNCKQFFLENLDANRYMPSLFDKLTDITDSLRMGFKNEEHEGDSLNIR